MELHGTKIAAQLDSGKHTSHHDLVLWDSDVVVE